MTPQNPESKQRPRSVVWLHGEIKTPPFTRMARIETGVLLRRLQNGEMIGMPASRPMPVIGRRCHELRIKDEAHEWRLIYKLDSDAILICDVFAKTTNQTPQNTIEVCRRRLALYDVASQK